MKSMLAGILGTGLLVLPWFPAPTLAARGAAPFQEPQQPDKDKQRPKPEPQQQPPTPPKEPRPEPKPKERKPEPNERTQNPDTGKRSKEQRKQQERSTTQSNAQHPRGQRIPAQKFQANFGSQHTFRPQHLQDNRRFQYAGYWFEIVEVWPADWSFDDDCYIDQIGNDYYLFDAFHPGVRLLVIVVS